MQRGQPYIPFPCVSGCGVIGLMVIVSFEISVYKQRVRDLGRLNGMSPSNSSPWGSSTEKEKERLSDPEGIEDTKETVFQRQQN